MGSESEDLLLTDDRKYVELTFVKIILEFFNFHVSMAKREHNSRMKVKWLIENLLPPFSELRVALKDYYVHEDVRSKFLFNKFINRI